MGSHFDERSETNQELLDMMVKTLHNKEQGRYSDKHQVKSQKAAVDVSKPAEVDAKYKDKDAQAMPAVVAGRPQRTEQMFQALKRHILKERQKKKQEQEADAEVERQRKEREAQQKQNVMTLGENREQISQLEQLLAQLKDEKHQLFLKLKKVLNEDDNRRRQQLVRQQESNEVIDMYGSLFPAPPISSHISQHVLHQDYPVADRNPLYKVLPSHTLLPPGSLKRARSPSPPPQTSYPQNYGQKPPTSRVSYQKSTSSYGAYYPAPGTTGGTQSSYTYSGPHLASASGRTVQQPQGDGVPPVPPPQAKHPTYIAQPLSRPPLSQSYMHSSLEHSKPSYTEEKFYSVPPIRPATHVPVHGGVIPIQQPAQGAKTGGITSGYPIRPPSSAPPPHVVSSPATPHSVYGNQSASTSRLVYSQARGYVPRES